MVAREWSRQSSLVNDMNWQGCVVMQAEGLCHGWLGCAYIEIDLGGDSLPQASPGGC